MPVDDEPTGLKPEQEEFISWLLLSKRDRQIHGLPLLQKDWAEWKGLTDRTLRRWKQDETFQQVYEQRRMALAREITPNSTVTAEQVGGARPHKDARSRRRFEKPKPAGPEDDPANDPALSPGERDYMRARRALLELAENGEKGALELYYKYYGHEFVKAEQEADEKIVDLDDDTLVDEVVSMLGTNVVAESLARLTSAEAV